MPAVTDFLDVGGVKIPTVRGSWTEEYDEVGDVADDAGGLALSGRPIESRAAESRVWQGMIPWNAVALDGVVAGSAPAAWERMRRWVSGWGQCFPQTNNQNLSGAGLVFSPTANITMSAAGGPYATGKMTVASATEAHFTHRYAMRVRRGFDPTGPNGFTAIFFRNFIATETVAAGYHWCVATGRALFAQGSGNPAGITQYVDGAAGNFSVGNVAALDDSQLHLYGKKTDGVTNSAIEYADIALLPFQLPATWIAQIYTNLINAATKVPFPVLPRQRLSGQWLINEAAPVEAIGRAPHVVQHVGNPQGQAHQTDLREIALRFREW